MQHVPQMALPKQELAFLAAMNMIASLVTGFGLISQQPCRYRRYETFLSKVQLIMPFGHDIGKLADTAVNS